MEFRGFVEAGRVVLITYGKDYGKLAVIVDVLDQNKCLIDGPCTEVSRKLIQYTRIELTEIIIPIKRGSRTGIVKKIFEEEKVSEKFAASAWGKKLAIRKRRAELTDYERFQTMVLRKKRAKIVNKKFKELKSKA